MQGTRIEEISTRWPQLSDPLQFVMRYAPAIRAYLLGFTREPALAEELCQDFILRYLQSGLRHASPDRGRFRYYLKAAVRNSVRQYARSEQSLRRREMLVETELWEEIPVERPDAFEEGWRKSVLERAWEGLRQLQKREKEVRYYDVLRLSVSFPEEDSTQLSRRLQEISQTSIKAETFRKQLSRSRRLFAQQVVREVARTLEQPTLEGLREELEESGLMPYLKDYPLEEWGREVLG